MTILANQISDEALRCLYVLSQRGTGELVLDIALVALVVTFARTGWRLLKATRLADGDRMQSVSNVRAAGVGAEIPSTVVTTAEVEEHSRLGARLTMVR
jgi:hypothetical protein